MSNTTKITKEECIENLRSMCTTDKVVSRDYYRANSVVQEKDWIQYFGTWNEFKKAAGVANTRNQEKYLREIAKHASVDTLRKATIDKMQWSGKYLLDTSKERFKTVLVCSDIHDKQCDPFYRRLLLETSKRVQPNKIILNGDIFDLEEFSRYTHDPRTFDIKGSVEWVDKFFSDLRKSSPNSEITLVEGNHECRLAKYLAESSPALVSLMSDYHGWSIADLLGLTKHGINYHAFGNLTAFTSAQLKKETEKNKIIVYDALLFHHFPHGANEGMPGSNGHHHSHVVSHHYNAAFGPYEWHQTGAGHRRVASYCDGEKWSNGFLLCHVDTHTKRTQFEYIDCTGDICCIGGKYYYRQEDEALGPIIVSYDDIRKIGRK